MTDANKVKFMPRWKEELVCTMDGRQFVTEITMGVLTVYFPTLARWEKLAPDWARPHWPRVHRDLVEWCAQQNIPLKLVDDGWVQFE